MGCATGMPGAAASGAAVIQQCPAAAVLTRGLRRDRSKDGSRTVCSVCLENYAEGDKVRQTLGHG